MSGAVCPSCGVAVVPGYVRCPKCHSPLPRRSVSALEGGTAVQTTPRKAPLVAVLAAVALGVAILIYLGVRKTDKPAAAAPSVEESQAVTTAAEPAPAPEQAETAQQPTGPNALDVAANLERALKKQRLWSTVTVVGGRVDVRSGSCADAAMTPALDGAASAFKAAGLTKLRCLEQSGRVVTERDL
jgi:hypothetical protein